MSSVRTFVGRAGLARLLAVMVGLVTPSAAIAQLVQGQLRDSTSGAPIQGALVLLMTPTGEQRGGGLSGADGRFHLRAPGPGRFSLRAERIGFETTTSHMFEVSVGRGVQLILDMTPQALALEGLEVSARRRCSVGAEEGRVVAMLWEEAQKALRNQEWTESMGLVRFRLVEYERDVDAETGIATAEDRRSSSWVGRNPIRSLPAEDLVDGGFVRSDGVGGFEYYGPDAAVLLSDAFLATHCFGLALAPDAPDLVGLTFRPLSSRRGAADIEGTLWLGHQDARLRFLDFDYTWSPWLEADGVAKGRVDFEELPEGAWIIPRWWIRMPRMTRAAEAMPGDRSGLRVAGVVEVGATATPAEARSAALAAGAEPGQVHGVVWDSTRASPLSGANVVVVDRGSATTTNAEGLFALADVPAGRVEVGFRHPRLDSLGVVPPTVEVEVVPGQAAEVVLSVPSLPSILGALCRGVDHEPGTSAAVGRVRTARGGDAVPGAEVSLEWTDYRVAGGREILADVQTLHVKADEDGRYVACGVPPGVILAARASSLDVVGGIRRVEVPSLNVVSLDLALEAVVESNEGGPPSACPSAPASAAAGAVVGQVREGGTGVAIGLSDVWLVPAGDAAGTSVKSDPAGRFVFCAVHPGAYRVRAAIRGVGRAETSVDVRAGEESAADLQLRTEAEEGGAGGVRGRVVTFGDRQPVPGAEVRLNGSAVRLSAADGSFVYTEVPVGTATLSVTFVGYAPATGEVVVGRGQSLTLEVRLSPEPIELEPIVVEAVRFSSGGVLSDVRRRAQSAFGTVLMGASLESKIRTATWTTDVLRGQGVTILSNGTALYFNRTGCGPHVYIDGVKVTHVPRSSSGRDPRAKQDVAEVDAARALNMVDPSTIAAVEIYRGPGETPGEFLDSDARCGVILIWTRRGDEIGRGGR